MTVDPSLPRKQGTHCQPSSGAYYSRNFRVRHPADMVGGNFRQVAYFVKRWNAHIEVNTYKYSNTAIEFIEYIAGG